MMEQTVAETMTAITKNESLSKRVSRLLFAEIQSGMLKPGDKLPPEAELAKKYGISRTIVREALASLKNDDILESKQGKGILVKNPDERQAFRISDVYESISRAEVNSLYEIRAILEAEAAWLAAFRDSKNDKEKIQRCFNKMKEAYDAHRTGEKEHFEYNNAIAKASHNPVLQEFLSFLLGRLRPLIKEFRSEAVKDPNRSNLVLEEHAVITEAIIKGDPAAAREAVFSHHRRAAQRTGLEIFKPSI